MARKLTALGGILSTISSPLPPPELEKPELCAWRVADKLLVHAGINPRMQRKGKSGETNRRRGRTKT